MRALLLLFFAGLLLAGETRALAQSAPRVPDGFRITRVAADPLTKFPMFGAFDERGRLFVAESSGLDLYAELTAQTRRCQIRWLEDRDGDGSFETGGIFADHLVFPMGLAWRAGKLYVADPPDLITLEDTDGDGRADRRQVVLTGFGHTDNGSLHGLIFGPDGWLYLTMGEPDGYKLRRADGSILEGRSGALLRCRPDGSDVTVLCRGFENLVELIFTPAGEMIGTDNWFQRPTGGIRDALVHLVEGGLYPYAADAGTPQPVTGPPLPAVSLFPAIALSGLEIYRGTSFPASLQGQLFSAQHNSRKIGRHQLHRQGSSWRTEDADFVTSEDPDFHPSDVLEDADGSLLVIDTGSWYTHHCPTGRIRTSPAAGGIFRVRATRAQPVSDPWGLKENWAQSSMARVLELLADPRPAVRARAQRLLARRGAANLDQLRPWLLSSTNRLARLGGLWALAEIESAPAGEILRALLEDPDLEIAMAAALVLTVRPDRAAAPTLQAMLASPEAPVRLAAAQALTHCGNAQSLPFLWNALTNSPDRFLVHALVHAAHHLADAPALQAALAQPSPRVQEAALRLLAQPPRARLSLTSEMLLSRLESTDASLGRAAWELLRQRSNWAAEAATALRREPRPHPNSIQENAHPNLSPESWQELFLAFERSSEVQAVVTGIFQTGSVFAITQLLEALPRSELAKPPAGWIDGIVAALVRPEPRLRSAATRAAARWPEGASRLVPALQSLTQETNQPPTLRLEAARALLLHQPEPTPALFAWLLDYMRPNGDPVLTLAASFALSRGQLSDAQLVRLFAAMGSSPLVPPMQFLRTFRHSNSATDAAALVEVVGRWLETGWRPADREFAEFTQRLPETLRSRAAAMRTSSLSQPIVARQRLKLDSLTALLQGGSPPAGRQIFFGSKSGCSACHTIGADGGRVGPDLTRLGLIRSGHDLLESIVFPSATFAQGYEPYTVITKDGAEWNGFLAEQSAEAVLLREPSGMERRMPREEIQELRRQSVSAMPEGLEQALTETEFRDLLAFLQSLR